jgi:hypothetical protein
VNKTLVAKVLCLTLLCSLPLLAQEHARVAYVRPTSTVHTAAQEVPAGLTIIYSNLGPKTAAFNPAIGFYLLGPKSSFGFSQNTALPFTPAKDSTVTIVQAPIQWYNDGSADFARISIYSDASGVPGTLLAGPFFIRPPAGFTCCTLTPAMISPGLSVTAGTQYWVVADTTAASNFDGLWLVKPDAPITGFDQNGTGWLEQVGYDLGAAGIVLGTVP